MNGKTLAGCILLVVWLACMTTSCGTLSGQDASSLDTAPTASQQVQPGQEPGTVDAKWFASMMSDLPPDIHLVDVRSKWAFAKAHLPGAVNLPRKVLFRQGCESYIARLPQEGTIILLCLTGKTCRSVYLWLRDKCRHPEMDRVFFLDAEINHETGTLVLQPQ